MEGKVKCSGCGWSWNKSDSSKKDMYVCHQCGKDNVMKNGGWLNKYDDGGPVQPNYNDASVSMSDDFVGLGYDTKGRNYSPAWGGQFQLGGKLNPVSPMQQIEQAVQPTPTVPYLQTKDPAEFYKSWIQSPEYAKRQLFTGYSQGEDLYMPNAAASRESRLGAIEDMAPITYNTREPSKATPGVYGSPSYVNINPSDYTDTSKQAIEAHELAHVAGAMGEVRPGMMSATEQDIFKKSMLPMKEPVLSGVQGSKEREASKRNLEDFKHSQEPDEVKADLDALRFMMYDKGIYDITKGNKFTETDFEKSKQNFGKDRVFNRLEKRVGKKNFVNLMNTIASADNQEELPMAMGGMSIPGSVGFTYARTAGSAPSEGKYAKKTMASAQNGIMSPMLLARNVLNYFYPNEENTNTVEAAPADYKKGLTNELLQRQAYKESTFNPAAVSPAGYKGLTQIGEGVLEDYSNKKGGKKLDPFNPEDAVELQKFAMDDLYNASFINKPDQSDSVRIAKTLAAYNWGRGNLSNYLNEQKSKGVDIYDSYDWLNNLPKETSDYVNKILLQEDPSFNKNYKKASTNPKYEDVTSLYDQKKFGGDIPSAQNGQEMRFYQNGLDWKPKSMKEGGITKDNQGYWNPNNFGKVVEINSNDITMEGVYEPLLGVSDTGDTKLMKPGKNYKFKGKKVREYPVAQIGKNIPFKGAANSNPKNPANPVREDFSPSLKEEVDFPIDYNKDEVTMQKNWLNSYIKSPKYTERLKKEFPGKTNEFIKNEVAARLNNLSNAKLNYVNSIGKSPGWIAGSYAPKKAQGETYDYSKKKWIPTPPASGKFKPGNVYLESEYKADNFSPYRGFETIPLHEFGHAVDDGGSRIPDSTIRKIYNYTKDQYDYPSYKKGEMEFSYENTPSEFVNRIQPIRYLLNRANIYDAKSSDFTEEHYDRMMENMDIFQNQHYRDVIRRLGNDDDIKKKAFIDLMNTIAYKNDSTEIPVGKLGINQLDAQPMKKLNQLLNFTNNPDKDNWLDKYN
jgi:hypothetical protein